ncbi:MAG TPA: hypothetical protein VJP40_05320 [bacterium]|nr:hypothetical protein [bacterium]
MTFSDIRKRFKGTMVAMALAALALQACSGSDKPFTIADDTPPSDGGPNPGTGNPPPGAEGCTVNFNGKMQLQVSSAGMAPIIGSRFIDIPPIPIKVDGNNLTLVGADFPRFKAFIGDNPPADLWIHGDPSNNATGTYDPASGKIEINDLKFLVDVKVVGAETDLGPPLTQIPTVKLTTDAGQSASGNGNPASITVDGAAVNKSDRSLTMVAVVTLPGTLGGLAPIDEKLGGGALTAVFQGNLDQLPESCVEGGGTPGGGGTGGSGPSEFAISDGSNANVGTVDFGATLALVKSSNGKTILDCTDASNRGLKSVIITLTNKSAGERKIKIGQPADSDVDPKDPLCSGSSEFVRGAVSVAGGASCETVTVGGKEFMTGECTLPESADAKIQFPLMYVPYNFVAASGGAAPEATPAATPGATPGPTASVPQDTGALVFEYDDGKTFSLSLKGKTEPDSRDALSISKVKEGVVSKKNIRNGQLVKIALLDTDPKPFTQEMAIKNTSADLWQNITVEVEAPETGTSAFVVENLAATNLPGGSTEAPSTVKFNLVYTPSAAGADQGKLIVKLVKSGSSAVTELKFDIAGSVGAEPVLGNYELRIDFLTAFMDNALQPKPTESLDFREFPAQAPPPRTIIFSPVNEEELEPIEIIPLDFDPLTATKAQRMSSLRIFNAQGSGLVPGDDESMCHEPDNINKPYVTGDCAFFYFSIGTSDDSEGFYDDETGHMTIPNLKLQVRNPYHGPIGGGVWPASAPGVNVLDTTLDMSLTTQVIDKIHDGDLTLVPDSRVSQSQLNILNNKPANQGDPCPEDPAEHPHFKCYVTADGKYMTGKPLRLRPGTESTYDVVVVAVTQFNPKSVESDIPVFMDNNTRMYLAIQGRLCKEGTNCE